MRITINQLMEMKQKGEKFCMLTAYDYPTAMTYHTSIEDALRNAGRFLQEGGARTVKLEGGEAVAEKVRHIVASGIPAMGHLGYTPQSTYQ